MPLLVCFSSHLCGRGILHFWRAACGGVFGQVCVWTLTCFNPKSIPGENEALLLSSLPFPWTTWRGTELSCCWWNSSTGAWLKPMMMTMCLKFLSPPINGTHLQTDSVPWPMEPGTGWWWWPFQTFLLQTRLQTLINDIIPGQPANSHPYCYWIRWLFHSTIQTGSRQPPKTNNRFSLFSMCNVSSCSCHSCLHDMHICPFSIFPPSSNLSSLILVLHSLWHLCLVHAACMCLLLILSPSLPYLSSSIVLFLCLLSPFGVRQMETGDRWAELELGRWWQAKTASVTKQKQTERMVLEPHNTTDWAIWNFDNSMVCNNPSNYVNQVAGVCLTPASGLNHSNVYVTTGGDVVYGEHSGRRATRHVTTLFQYMHRRGCNPTGESRTVCCHGFLVPNN